MIYITLQRYYVQSCLWTTQSFFFSQRDINVSFEKINKELTNVSNWFNANKLSLNVKKTKYSFFHKSSKNNKIPLRLPNLSIIGLTVQRESSTKFLGVWIEENLKWRNHIHTVENKIVKNIGLLYQEKPLNVLSVPLNVLNFYQINIFQSVQFMRKIKNKNVPHIFLKLFGVPCHAYPTNFSLINFSVPRIFLKVTRFPISPRDAILWNNCLSKNEKEINNFLLFKQSTAANFFQ